MKQWIHASLEATIIVQFSEKYVNTSSPYSLAYPHALDFHSVGNDMQYHCTLAISFLPIELLIDFVMFSFKTSPSWQMVIFSYNTYFINYKFPLHIFLNTVFQNNCPTNDNNSSPAFGACNANRPHPMYGCIDTLTSHFMFQYVKGVSFKITHEAHCPQKVSVSKLCTNLCRLLNELGSPFL